jgi:hypothetical protein
VWGDNIHQNDVWGDNIHQNDVWGDNIHQNDVWGDNIHSNIPLNVLHNPTCLFDIIILQTNVRECVIKLPAPVATHLWNTIQENVQLLQNTITLDIYNTLRWLP